jgi:hypothetical protein
MKRKKIMDTTSDLPDSAHDKRRMAPEKTVIDLPDVEDIPGQEHVTVPKFGEFADSTIASDGEEGTAVFDQQDDEGDVTDVEKSLLRQSASQSPGDEEAASLKAMALDETDEEGAPLNEGNLKTDLFGEDLDLPEGEETDEEETQP